MGSVVSYRGGYDVNRSSQKRRMGGSRNRRRRDSFNRPVLKLHINTTAFERNQQINGQTSLDHPFLRRISRRRFESVDLTSSPHAFLPHSEQACPSTSMGNHHAQSSSSSQHSIHSQSSVAASNATINTDQSGISTPRRASQISTSMIVVKFVENSTQPSPRYATRNELIDSRSKPESDHLCLCDYRRVETGLDDEERMGTLVFGERSSNSRCSPAQFELDELKKRIIDHIDPFENLPESDYRRSRRYTRSRSTDALSSMRVGRNVTMPEPRYMRSQSVTDTQDYATVDVQVELEEDGWTFGESIMRTLEAEGITIFDVVNPQTKSDRQVDQTWPELKNKMRQWRSQQSILDLDDDAVL